MILYVKIKKKNTYVLKKHHFVFGDSIFKSIQTLVFQKSLILLDLANCKTKINNLIPLTFPAYITQCMPLSSVTPKRSKTY